MSNNSPIQVIRRPEIFQSDDARVITRFFSVGGEDRIRSVIQRVTSLDPENVESLLEQVIKDFGSRHKNFTAPLQRHFDEIVEYVDQPDDLTEQQRLLLGAYFTMEYSIESAALFNPSIVSHPDQAGMGPGQLRFIMSLRATGEGHISSIVFRTGMLDDTGHVEFDPPGKFVARLRVHKDRKYDKKVFFLKLVEMGAYCDQARFVLDELGDQFTYHQLEEMIGTVRDRCEQASPFNETSDNMLWLARSNYRLQLPPDTDPSEIVIFPTSENESKGIEDVRLTRFVDDDGSVTYYGTYTAYNGFRILPQLLETPDFCDIRIHTLNGKYVQNKGMALFPRRIKGMYHMVSRLDGENMFLMRSDNVHFWNEAVMLQGPRYPWEFVQVGNCGPPIETEIGWILLTHGVGPMRQYCIGVSLLDLDDPTRIIGHMPEPLLVPQEHERDGYVPNVVYSCGAIKHGDILIMPYAMSDSATSFATCRISELLEHLTRVTPLCPLPLKKGKGQGKKPKAK
jgi:predicted GH43/DUF377 family glycosyl hydrolase